MPNASQTNLNEVDDTHSAADIPVGISGVEANLNMGPVARPDLLVTSWNQFVSMYGGLDPANLIPTIQIKRAFDRGSSLRICRVLHYTTISDKTSLTALKAASGIMKKVFLASAIGAGHVWNIIIDGTTFSQVYAVSALNTTNLLAAQINAAIAAGTLPTMTSALAPFQNRINLTTNGVAVVTSSTSGTSSPAVTVADVTGPTYNSTLIGNFIAKYPGVNYNNVVITISNASNGNANAFNVTISYLTNPSLNKTVENIVIPLYSGNIGPTIAQSNYMDKLINSQEFVDFAYADLSSTSSSTGARPENGAWRLTGGTNGGAVTATDYIGDSASVTGLQAFNGIDDIMQFAVIDNFTSAVAIAAAAYAVNRRDLSAFHHLDNSLVNANAYVAARDAMLIDTSFMDIFAGGLTVVHPFNSQQTLDIPELGDILGIAAYSDDKFGTHYSFAGGRRGVILNALGVVNNFGSAGAFADRNYMANHGINVVCISSKKIMLKGNFTAQVANSQFSYSSIRRMIIGLKKQLGPILDFYIEEPNDFTTWKALFLEIKPLMKSYKDKRAIFDWDWQGDQFADSLDDLVINNVNDVLLGKYKAKLFMHAINSLQELTLDVTLSSSGVSFEDNLSALPQ